MDYTKAAGADDETAKRAARDDLAAYATSFAGFLAKANPELDEAEVADALSAHAQSLLAVIDAQAADDPRRYELLRQAAGHMPAFAELLATALVAQFPERFGA